MVKPNAARRTVAVNENGRTVGGDHHRAKLTDHEVEMIRELIRSGLGLRVIAEKFEVSWHTIRSISCGRARAQTVVGWRLRRARRTPQGA